MEWLGIHFIHLVWIKFGLGCVCLNGYLNGLSIHFKLCMLVTKKPQKTLRTLSSRLSLFSWFFALTVVCVDVYH